MPASRERRSVLIRVASYLAVAGVAMSVVLGIVEWRRMESRLRVDIAQTATRVTHDLASLVQIARSEGAEDVNFLRDLVRATASEAWFVGVTYDAPSMPIAWGREVPAIDASSRVVLLPGGSLASEAVRLDQPLVLFHPAQDGTLTLVVDGASTLAGLRSTAIERVALQLTMLGALILFVLLLMRRWIGEPLADLSELLAASANAETLAALARTQSGDVGRLATSMADLLHTLETQNDELARREREYADLFERAPAAMVSIDRLGTITHANTAAEALLGESGTPLERRRIADLVQVEDHATLDEVMFRLKHDDAARCRLRLRAGVQRSATEVSIEVAAVRTLEGELESVRLSITDVSGAVRVRERLLERVETMSVALDHVPDAVMMVDDAGKVLVANRAMLAMLRRDRVEHGARVDEAVFWDGLGLADCGGWIDRVRHIVAQPGRTVHERLATINDAGAILVHSSPVRDTATGLSGRVWLLRDASGEEQRERAKREQKHRLRGLQLIGAALAETRDVDGLMERALRDLRAILGVEAVGLAVRGQQTDRRTKQLMHAGGASVLLSTGRTLADAVARELFPRITRHAEMLHWPDLDAGEAAWAGGFKGVGLSSLTACPISNGQQVIGVLWAGQRGGIPLSPETMDLIETLGPLLAARLDAAQASERLRRLHLLDPVTELPSVLQFDRAMQLVVGRAHEQFAMLAIDLDHFENFNRTHGRPAGDVVLREIASRLLASNRKTCFVARFAGAAFGILLTEATRDHATQVAQRLRRVISETPVDLPDGSAIHVTASFGVSVAPADGRQVDELLDLALVRVHAAKQAGGNRVVAESPLPLLQAG